MKNKKLSAALLVLTMGFGFGASSTAMAISSSYCKSLFQSCEYMNNQYACEQFDNLC